MASAAAVPSGTPISAPPAVLDKAAIEVEHRGLLQVAVMLAVVLQILDATIANVALPHMQAALGASQDSISWVLTSYIVASAVAIPITGWLADRVGVRTLMLCSVAGFVMSSMLCGISQNLPQMVMFRLMQGVSGAFLSPLAQNLLYDINPPSKQTRAAALFGQGVMVGPVIGPILGGFLTENFDWRWVFFINVPLGAIAFAMLLWLMPANRYRRRPFNLFAFAMLTVAIGGIQLLMDRGERVDWFEANESWITLSIAVSGLWMFLVAQMTSSRPLYRRSMFLDRNITMGCVLMLALGLVAIAAMALLPPMLQTLFGYSVEEAGLLIVPRGVTMVIAMMLSSRLIMVLDARLVLAAGFMIVSFSLWLMTGWTLDMDWWPIFTSGCIQGFGLGLIFVTINVISLASADPEARTDAVSLLQLMRNLGQSIGITIMTVLIAQNTQRNHSEMADILTPQHLDGINQGMIESLGQYGGAAAMMLDAQVNRQALMISYINDFKVMMIGTACCLLLLPLMKKPQLRRKGEEIHVME